VIGKRAYRRETGERLRKRSDSEERSHLMAEEEGEKPDKKEKKRTTIDDWMVRISFAEAGEPDMGFKATGLDILRKTKLALEKIMVVRSEKASQETGARKGQEVTREPAAGEKLQVMILDDEPIVGKRLQPTLTKAGFEVEVFLDPAEALARLGEKEFDIVVTDLRMEGMDGIHILEHVMEHCQHTRVILITGYATVEVAREALVKGAFDFIAKPFKPRELTAVVNKAALSLGHKPVVE
jgi:CheY-like chemotaxis protein